MPNLVWSNECVVKRLKVLWEGEPDADMLTAQDVAAKLHSEFGIRASVSAVIRQANRHDFIRLGETSYRRRSSKKPNATKGKVRIGWNEERLANLKVAWAGAVPISQIAQQFGLAENTVSDVAHRYGFGHHPNSRLKEEPKPKKPGMPTIRPDRWSHKK